MRFTLKILHNDAMTVCRKYEITEDTMIRLAKVIMAEAPQKFPAAKMIVLDIEATFTTFEEIAGGAA
jgi:hypothetical protein